ncbi:MAG: hypothetical protein H6Q69_3570 [Firmicutes bacterium]|nr:hypothetical protein [Bacillota bacterium]
MTVKLGINIISYIHKYILVEYLLTECINKNVKCNIDNKEAGKSYSLYLKEIQKVLHVGALGLYTVGIISTNLITS